MVNKTDSVKLEQHIGELNSLYSEWSGYSKKAEDLGDNSGRAVNHMIEISKSLQLLQDGFVSLLGNTISYMTQRKDSVENKEKIATDKINQ